MIFEKNNKKNKKIPERENVLPARFVMALERARAEDTPLPVPDMSSPSSSLENFSFTISASATHQRKSCFSSKIAIRNSRTGLPRPTVQERWSPEGGPSCRAGLGGTACDDELPAAPLSDGPPASGGGRSTESRLPLDPQLLDRIRLVEGAAAGGPSMVLPSEASDSGDDGGDGDDDDTDLRRLNENLSRPIFWNGRAITGAWLARARSHALTPPWSLSWQRERRGGGGWLDFGGCEGGEEGRGGALRSAGRLRLLFVAVGGRQAEEQKLVGFCSFLAAPTALPPSLGDGNVPSMRREAPVLSRAAAARRSPVGWLAPPKYKEKRARLNWAAVQHGSRDLPLLVR